MNSIVPVSSLDLFDVAEEVLRSPELEIIMDVTNTQSQNWHRPWHEQVEFEVK